MRVTVISAVAALVLSCFGPGAGAVAAETETGGRIIAGGGTQLTNGVFFPGTAFPRSDGGFDGSPPLQIPQGTDVEVINLDEATLANAHKVVSLKRRKGRPVFTSDLLTSPGQTDIIVTSKLKPGIYPYYCSVHSTMWGQIEVVN